MPHYLGWHPFFKSTDKKRTALQHWMNVHYDYTEHKDRKVCRKTENLSEYWDDVFHSPDKRGFIFENIADGYKVDCDTDDSFDSLVLCTWVNESICVEPWCGLPNSINTGRFLKWIAPSETAMYRVMMDFSTL